MYWDVHAMFRHFVSCLKELAPRILKSIPLELTHGVSILIIVLTAPRWLPML